MNPPPEERVGSPTQRQLLTAGVNGRTTAVMATTVADVEAVGTAGGRGVRGRVRGYLRFGGGRGRGRPYILVKTACEAGSCNYNNRHRPNSHGRLFFL